MRVVVGCAIAMMTVCSAAMAQAPAGPAGPAAEVQRSYAGVKANILKIGRQDAGD